MPKTLKKINKTNQTNLVLLGNSRVVRYLINLCKVYKGRIMSYSKTSLTISLIRDIKEELYFLPVKTISIITIATIAVNVFLCLTLQKEISLWAWLVQGLFFFAAVAGLFCKLDWPKIEESSMILKKKNKNNI